MADSLESIDAELQRQKRVNAKLLDLLGKVDAAFPNDRVGPMIDEAKRTKEILGECEDMIKEKKGRDHA